MRRDCKKIQSAERVPELILTELDYCSSIFRYEVNNELNSPRHYMTETRIYPEELEYELPS
jgi:hypothetical protein